MKLLFIIILIEWVNFIVKIILIKFVELDIKVLIVFFFDSLERNIIIIVIFKNSVVIFLNYYLLREIFYIKIGNVKVNISKYNFFF